MRGIFFTADDLGISREANEAMLHAHIYGALHGAALMMGQPGTDHGVELARKNPALHVGFHLHLCDSAPLTLSSAAWPWGSDPAHAGWAIGTQRSARRLAEAEIARQWQEFRATGLSCAFINAHHHLHVHPFVMARLKEIVGTGMNDAVQNATEKGKTPWWRWGQPRWFGETGSTTLTTLYNTLSISGMIASAGWGAVRAMSRLPAGARSPRTLWGIDRSFRMDAGEVQRAILHLEESEHRNHEHETPQHEFLFHPRRISPEDKDLQTLLKLRFDGDSP